MTDLRYRIVNRKVNPLLTDLPDWAVEFRPHQREAINRIVDAYSRVPVVVLAAPTGSGKTLIAETVRRIMGRRALYICTSKSLQDQFLHDFPYAKVLKGRGNYPTILAAKSFHPGNFAGHVSCEDCTWTMESPCKWCPQKSVCPYETAKTSALRSQLAVLNTSYFLTEANHVGKFSKQEFVIADEADSLEGTLMGYVSVEISESRLSKLGWEPPEKVTVQSSWEEWLDKHIPLLRSKLATFPDVIDDLRVAREARVLNGMYDRLLGVRRGLETGAWVYTGRGRKDVKGRGVSFRPSRVDFLGDAHLWNHSEKWLLMSATVISSEEMLGSLGYSGPYETVTVANTFPVENRRVVVRPTVAMSNKNKEEAWPFISHGVLGIVNDHADDRILVHTVSYALTEFLAAKVSSSRRPTFTYLRSEDKDRALDGFLSTPRSVLLTPSMERGVDLPGDLCRVQVIVKVPYPYLGDRQISARLHSRDGQTWYTVQTIRELVQMCGRAVRSIDDWAVTYVLDDAFANSLWPRGRSLFPDWFRDAVVWKR